MLRLMGVAALAAALVVTAPGRVVAAPPGEPAPSSSTGARTGWSVVDGQLVWRSTERVPVGGAAVEFWAGDRLIGRPRPLPDGRTFAIDLKETGGLGDLQVKAGGRRIDVPVPAVSGRRAAPPAATSTLPPAGAVDPGKPGPYPWITGEYDLPGIDLPGFEAETEMRAVVVAPRGATGARPLALFLHGRHEVCFDAAGEMPFEWPCPEGSRPVPSYRGYLQAQQLLASQGYVTVSISANGINGQDWSAEDGGAQARSTLVREHLRRWTGWAGADRAAAPGIVRQAPRADLGRVFLMGHSRGGEGVSRAAMDSLTPPPGEPRTPAPWTIRGLLLLGPTIFGHDPVPDVPSVTVLPGCDGDVFDLQGQMFIDETRGVSRGKALHSSLYVVGANHNFFNTEWTPGQSVAPSRDDFARPGSSDPICSPGTPTRLTAAQQQNVGATYIAAAARLFTDDDDRVLPLLDGTGVRAPSADPARVLSHAIGGHRTPVLLPDPAVGVKGGGRICDQVADTERSCLDPDDRNARIGHFTSLLTAVPEPGRYAAELNWSRRTPIRFTPQAPVRVAGHQEIALRVIVPPNSTGTRFGVTAVEESGRRTLLGDVRLDGLPGTDRTTSYWAQEVRVPVRTSTIAALEFTPRSGSGPAWLLDAWAWNPGTPDPQTRALPRVDVGRVDVVEGDTGSKTYQAPVSVTGSGGGLVRFLLYDVATEKTTSWVTRVRPGDQRIDVPIEVVGDTVYAEGEARHLFAKAEKGLVVGDWLGGVLIGNDDPEPTLTVDQLTSRVAEGGTLSWRLTMSAASETPYYIIGFIQPPTAPGVELSTTDVDPDWFFETTFQEPQPSRPLSDIGMVIYNVIPRGETTGELTIPTVADDLTEPDEIVEVLNPVGEMSVMTGVVTGG